MRQRSYPLSPKAASGSPTVQRASLNGKSPPDSPPAGGGQELQRGPSSDGDSIKVFCRFRPQNASEERSGGSLCAEFTSPSTVRVSGNVFQFDTVFNMESTQQGVFDTVARPIVDSVLRGFNGTIFAYGQTASGKTYTMEGPDFMDDEEQGVIPRIVSAVFDGIYGADASTEFVVRVSMFEIYNEMIKDLLNPLPTNLRVREDQTQGVFIEDLTELSMGSEEDVIEVMLAGHENRSTGATNMNEHSSRSHLVFTLTLEQKSLHTKSVKRGKLHLVDLAGSESIAKTGATGKRLDEAKNINSSLSVLGHVINSLTDRNKSHIPYRDSKLTRVLQESLGGNAKTSLIVACSPSTVNSLETLSSLRFGQRAKMIKNTPQINVELTVEEMKMMLAKKNTDLIESQKRVATLEKILKANGLPLPSSATISASGARQSGIETSGVSDLLEENQQLREKLKDKAENVAELYRLTETKDADKSKLTEEISGLRETITEKNQELAQRAEALESLSKAFEIFQQHAEAVESVKGDNGSLAGDVGSTSKTYADIQAWSSETEQGKRANATTKQKIAHMEKFVFQISQLVEGLIDKRNKAEAEKIKLQNTHDKLISSFQKLDDALRRQQRRGSDAADVGAMRSMHTMGTMRSTTPMGRRPSVRRPSVVAPKKSIIVKSLRGGLAFTHEGEDQTGPANANTQREPDADTGNHPRSPTHLQIPQA